MHIAKRIAALAAVTTACAIICQFGRTERERKIVRGVYDRFVGPMKFSDETVDGIVKDALAQWRHNG